MGKARDHKNLIVVGPIMPGNVIIVLTIIFTEIYLGFKASIGVLYYVLDSSGITDHKEKISPYKRHLKAFNSEGSSDRRT